MQPFFGVRLSHFLHFPSYQNLPYSQTEHLGNDLKNACPQNESVLSITYLDAKHPSLASDRALWFSHLEQWFASS